MLQHITIKLCHQLSWSAATHRRRASSRLPSIRIPEWHSLYQHTSSHNPVEWIWMTKCVQSKIRCLCLRRHAWQRPAQGTPTPQKLCISVHSHALNSCPALAALHLQLRCLSMWEICGDMAEWVWLVVSTGFPTCPKLCRVEFQLWVAKVYSFQSHGKTHWFGHQSQATVWPKSSTSLGFLGCCDAGLQKKQGIEGIPGTIA